MEKSDPLLRKLDIFGHPQFTKLVFTKRLFVTGSWYQTCDEIESGLSPQKLLSPAAGMLSCIIASLVIRMSNLQEFVYVDVDPLLEAVLI
jgi:hypothetical protein